ncbi:MAG TPA: FG-GAP-like repeat-containing protein [Cyclobacteriaceae bacterium]|nr:FG-GAP-like repeat-containing protein [Cyclobacteriaceae bacterium]
MGLDRPMPYMDNDGDQDIVSQSELNLIVTSNSAGVFLSSTIIESNAFTTGLYMGQFEIGDLNNDGLLDIACAAIYKNLTIYLNKGNSSFSTIILPNTKINDRGLLKLGDMDNDGDLDIFITGNPLLWDNTKKYNAVFENNNGTFTQIKLPIGEPMLIDWVDFDNDGDLDIIASGYNVDGIYINNLNSNKYKTNTKPTAPQILCSTLAGNKLTMSWNRASDGETPAPGLTYNVYVKQNGAWVMTPLSNPINGFRKVAQRGNVDHNLSWTITLPNTGNIEWGVQTVDAQYVGSTFTTASLQYSSIANTSKSICSGEKSNIGLSSPAANPTFSWIVKEASPNITGSSAGSGNILDQTLTNSSNTTTGVVTYEITESFPSCLKKKYEVRVTVNPRPSSVVSLNGSSIICQGESVRLTAPTGVNYLWTNGSTNSYIDVTIAGTYSVLVTNQFGCNQRSSNVQITVNPRPKIFITPASPVLICQGSSVTLTASPQYVSQGSSLVLANIFTWSSGVISNSITVSNPGIYTVSTYNIQNNCTISNTIEVLHYTPVINIIRSGDVCLNGSAVLSYSGPAYTSLLWSTGATSNSITVYGPGSYSVTANFAGCSVPITDYEVINPCNIDPCLNKVKNRIDPCAIARKAADVVNKTETNELWLVDEPTIFPNPASTKVVIAIPYVTEKDIPINVYNVTGLKVLSSNLNSGRYYCEISIPDVPDGLYLVQIGVGEKEIRQKLEILKK